MKVLQIIPYFVPAYGFGGPVTYCYSISKALIRNGNQVTVVTTDALNKRKRITVLNEVLDRIKIVRFRNVSKLFAKKYNIFLPIGYVRWMKSNLQNYNVVHLHDYYTFLNVIAVYFCKKYGIEYVIHPHGSAVPLKERGKQQIKTIFNYLFGNKILNNAKNILVLSRYEKDTLSSYLPKLTHKIIITSPIVKMHKKLNKLEAKRYLGIKDKATVISTLARLNSLKRIDLIIRGFSNLLSKGETILLVAGPDDGEQNNLKKLVNQLKLNKKVIFLGLVEGRDKEIFWSATDIFALFSQNDSLSLSALEAISYMIPVLISSGVGISEEVKKTECGIILNHPENQMEIEKAFNKILYTPTKYSANCIKIINKMGEETAYQNLINIYSVKT